MRKDFSRQSKSKYKNIKQYHDGIKFDSIKEAGRYVQLKLMEKQGLIKNLIIHPKYKILDGFEKLDRKFAPIHYIADFEYFDVGKNKVVVEDVKGFQTLIFRIKRKLFEKRYKNLTIDIIVNK